MAFTKIAAAGIGSTETVTLDGLTVINNVSIGGTLTYEDVTNVDSVGLITARNGIVVGSGITLSKDGHGFFTGIVTATSFVGSGANLTGITQTTINNNADNRIITGSGTANTLEGESTLTYGGTELLISNASPSVKLNDTDNSGVVDINNVGGVAVVQSTGDTVFETNSSERLRINSSGQIGIGANNNSDYDSSARNVLIASSGNTGITIRSGGSSDYGMIHFADGTSSAAEYRAGRLLYEHSTNSFLFYGANAFKLKINGDGDVGIGDNSPASRLTVTEDNPSGDVGIRVKNDTTTDGSAATPTTASLYLNTSTATFNTFYIQTRRYDNDTWMGYSDPTTAGHIPTLCLTNNKQVGINTHIPRCNGQNAVPGLHIVGRGIDPSPHYDGYADLVVESIESRIQITSDSGGTNASSLIMSSAVSATDNKHWVMEAAGASQSYKFHLGYMETTSTNFDSGSVTPLITVTTDGKLGFGKNDPDYHLDISDNTSRVGIRVRQQTNNTANTYSNMILRHAAAVPGQNAYGILFQNSGGTEVGKIDYGQSTTQYRTSSDYRLKENAVTISDGIARLKTLKPYRFNFISEPDRTVDGFFAHEVTAVPEAVSGTKDEVDSDNNPVYQGIDHSKLVPLLTAALQEAVTEIESLKSEVAALKE